MPWVDPSFSITSSPPRLPCAPVVDCLLPKHLLLRVGHMHYAAPAWKKKLYEVVKVIILSIS
jgi:hypothetical protein